MIEEEDEEKDILEDEETILRKKIEDMNKEISRYIIKHNYGCFYYLCNIRKKKETNEKHLIEERRKIRQLVIQDALRPEFKNDDEDSVV